ncbi:manganese/zinc/iron transport system permease protein [Tamaricihabitans halophyticus]|uniref:Manganese/zinc/iron transport system permease protein n=1 Tax=Tamaricihabitans halophyticus TaxID=1262583 RepID=A0A4R2R6Y4_9PSEU|nr:metal ABC transporter permease [Tamaricihabitans halophyticus]TCP55125.1 manganese/zinc/iron transport system permease protein [Tamaricihabitans halophyticus]
MNALLDLLPLPYPEAVVATGSAVLGFIAGSLAPFAVLRGRAMFGDAMSHGTLPGVALAFLFVGVKDPAVLLVGAAICALGAAALMIGLERAGRTAPDAAIGITLSASFALGIVLLTHIAQGGSGQQSGLDAYLFGQAAGMVVRDVWFTLILGGLALLAIVVFFRLLRSASFDPQFSAVAGVPTWTIDAASTALLVIAVVLGVRTVGAILMVALLVAPCVAARALTNRLGTLVPVSGAIGALAGVSGALLAGRAGLPTGPVIVLLATAFAAAALLFAPRRGVLSRAWRRHAARSARLESEQVSR